jgi:hypothetical protein
MILNTSELNQKACQIGSCWFLDDTNQMSFAMVRETWVNVFYN